MTVLLGLRIILLRKILLGLRKFYMVLLRKILLGLRQILLRKILLGLRKFYMVLLRKILLGLRQILLRKILLGLRKILMRKITEKVLYKTHGIATLLNNNEVSARVIQRLIE